MARHTFAAPVTHEATRVGSRRTAPQISPGARRPHWTSAGTFLTATAVRRLAAASSGRAFIWDAMPVRGP